MNIHAIDSLKYFAGAANELQRLRDRVAELEELLGITTIKNEFWRLPLSPQQRAIISVIYTVKIASRDNLVRAIFGMRLDCDIPENDRQIDVQLHRVRATLRKKGIELHNTFGYGWWMKDEDKAKLTTWIESLQ